MITIHNLTQGYKKKTVLDDVSLHIQQNERCALIGRNGAGKSTLIHSILGLLPIRQGQITLHGVSNQKTDWKRYVSYLPEKFQLYSQLADEGNLHFFATLAGHKLEQKRMEEALLAVDLWKDRQRRIKEYSKGMLQRLGLALMLYFDTEIFILDEPTSGLDPMGRESILNILRSLQNKTILLSSHHLEEIKQICTHVAYLEDGVITKYSMDQFLQRVEIAKAKAQ